LSQISAIEAIYTQQESVLFGADQNCQLMLEACAGFYFVDEAKGELISEIGDEENGQAECYRAVHGYSPKKPNYQTTLVAFGPGIAKGRRIAQARLVDEAPTFAEILGLKDFPKNIDGKIITELFVEGGLRDEINKG
ncbi:MAG: alkaline phosphatase family protein, partial [Streptococcaceae bacterium]|jgi:predicted AlkP superfamily pyrophosphatase or phosphodiesterase|nr:alkaline phosphatase family protein [Streptococcaceae bacterium]